jgi:hypothetical protein
MQVSFCVGRWQTKKLRRILILGRTSVFGRRDSGPQEMQATVRRAEVVKDFAEAIEPSVWDPNVGQVRP